jgi:hypothetical protein
VGEPLEALVLALEPGAEAGEADEAAGGVVLDDEAPEPPVHVFQRLDQAEDASRLAVHGDLLEAGPGAGREMEPIRPPGLEREVDARDLVEVVEHHQGGRVVEQRDAARLQAAVPVLAPEEAVELLLADELELLAHGLPRCDAGTWE